MDKKTDEQIAKEKAQADMEKHAGIKRKKKNKKEREREAAEAKYAGIEPDFCFVKRHIRQGVLPLLLETLLNTRANVKKLMKGVNPKTDPIYYSVLDGRQLALKVVCNSVYGFLKAFILTDKDLMAAVTSYGRNMIFTVSYSGFVFDCFLMRCFRFTASSMSSLQTMTWSIVQNADQWELIPRLIL